MRIGECWTYRGISYITTVFRGGARLDTRAVYGDDDYARATALGYGDSSAAVRRMNRQHDLAHTLLAHARGQDYSPVLYGVATDQPIDPALAEDEERIVLLLQRVSNEGIEAVARATAQMD